MALVKQPINSQSTLSCTFSATGGLLFSFGSVLSWAVIRSFLRQDQNLLATILGLGSGFLITKMAIDYVNLVDCKVVKCEPRN